MEESFHGRAVRTIEYYSLAKKLLFLGCKNRSCFFKLTKERYIMSTAKKGDSVKVHYTGTLDSGEVFDSSLEREPIAFTLGVGMMIPGFDKGVMGMAVGEKKKVNIPCDEAYGPHSEDNMMQIPKAEVPPGMEPKVGMMVEMRSPEGHSVPVKIAAISDEFVTLDGNHPLAGQDLNFDLELVSIE